MRTQGVVPLLLAGTLAISAAAPATSRAGSWVTYKSGNDSVRAYLAVPEGKGPHPGLIVIHEWWGLVDWITQNADSFAQRGYVALAIDLYHGETAATPEQAGDLARRVPAERALTDLKAADAFLKSRHDVNKSRIGAIGWCMGGTYSFVAATEIPSLAADVVCYGKLSSDEGTVKKLASPILIIYAGKDRTFTPDTLKAFQATAKKLKKNVAAHIYPDANHAFMNPGNKTGYRKDDTEDAWSKIYAFLDSKLKRR